MRGRAAESIVAVISVRILPACLGKADEGSGEDRVRDLKLHVVESLRERCGEICDKIGRVIQN